MKRRTFDSIASMGGLMLAIVLFVAAGLLNWGASFANNSLKDQLKSQNITIPPATGNSAESADVTAFFKANGGKVMETGKQAQMYADHFIGFHLSHMPTYEEASTKARALAADSTAAPAAVAAANATVDTVFKGTMLRGTLLTAYAFGTLGSIAGYAAWAMGGLGLLMLILALLGYLHLRRTPEDAAI